jgi:putative SOS response-associated peptidase YedK
MCGRVTQAYTWAEVHAALSLLGPSPSNLRQPFNVAPTTLVDVVADRGAGRELVKMIWGLAPARAKPDAKNPDRPEQKFATFNARSETARLRPHAARDRADQFRVGPVRPSLPRAKESAK